MTATQAVCEEETSSYARALAAYQDRRLEEALTYAQEAARQRPDHPDAQVLLGELYYLHQDLTRAKESWQKALKLAPSRQDVRERLEKLEKESQVERSLTRSDTHPFIVRFAEGQSSVDLGSIRVLLRDAYRMIGQHFEYLPDDRIAVILYPAADSDRVKGISHQVGGLYDGKIRLPLDNHSGSIQRMQGILWHEYTHALVHDLSKGRCPAWLNEGIATVQESRVYPIDLSLARKALEAKKMVGWNEYWDKPYPTDETQRYLYYQQAYLIARYFSSRWGWRQMVSLLNRLGQGYPLGDAIRAEYKIDPAVLEKEWLQWTRRQLA